MTPVHAWKWNGEPTVSHHDVGLINQTWTVEVGGELAAILQRLNTDIFAAEVHEDIEAITSHLEAAGLSTTRLIPTRSGDLWHTDADNGVWRALTVVGDRTIEKLRNPADAHSAGELVARFHAALHGFSWDFRSVRPGVHDTEAHLNRLAIAVDSERGHRLWWDTASLSETIFEGLGTLELPTGLPERIIHGDLKISNIRFAGSKAEALIDLDTLAWGTLDIELGDALRSWCNPSIDAKESRFNLDIFRSSMQGYAAGCRDRGPTELEWASIIGGLERICWELASRFALDVFNESYFGWDRASYPAAGEHNLARARGQVQLAKSVRKQRSAAEKALQEARI